MSQEMKEGGRGEEICNEKEAGTKLFPHPLMKKGDSWKEEEWSSSPA